jgi:hypothetical protein
LDASDSTKEAGLDQKARLRIFSGAGFHINTETGYYTADGGYEIVATTVLLSNGETGTILGRVGMNIVLRLLLLRSSIQFPLIK